MRSEPLADKIVTFIDMLLRTRHGESPGGLTVILGAGASMQYDLPGFDDLLRSLHRKIHPDVNCLKMNTAQLREGLDFYFRHSPKDNIHKLIRDHLPAVDGATCLGYRYLSRIVHKNYIQTIVTMNFDDLLYRALRAEGEIKVHPSQSFTCKCPGSHSGKCVKLISPNGSILDKDTTLTLGIGESNLFIESEEAAARKLLSENHVLIMGYSGIDVKICSALGATSQYKIVVIDPHGPGDNLWQVLARRGSTDLCLSGPDAGFEAFMERLALKLFRGKRRLTFPSPPLSYFPTLTEQHAIEKCRRLALRIRARLDVAEKGSSGLEQHADDVFNFILTHSRNSNLPLTSAEKFLLRVACYFHDLGFLWAQSEERRNGYPGFKLLKEHGALSEMLLDRNVPTPEDIEEIMPDSYSKEAKTALFQRIRLLCRLHSRLDLDSFWQEVQKADCRLNVDGCLIPVRFGLICSLLTLAEETLAIRLSPALTTLQDKDGIAAIDDPVSDLYCRALATGKTISPRTKKWLEYRRRWAVDNVRRISKIYHTSQGELAPDESHFREDIELQELSSALAEAMAAASDLRNLSFPMKGNAILDLALIYTTAGDVYQPEPRVNASEDRTLLVIRNADEHLRSGEKESLFHYYFAAKVSGSSPMQKYLRGIFEEIFYPALCYLSRLAKFRFNQVRHLLAMLRCGSSRFRPGLAAGLRDFFADNIHQNKPYGWWYGHDGCMQCTGKILECLVLARQTISADEMRMLVPRVDEYLDGICRFLTSEKVTEGDWMGLFEQNHGKGNSVREPAYTAAAISGMASALMVDTSLHGKLLSLPSGEFADGFRSLVNSRWRVICELNCDSVLSNTSELNMPRLLMSVGLCYLKLRRWEKSPPLPPFLNEGISTSEAGVGRTDRYRLIPARLALLDNSDTTQVPVLLRTMQEIRRDPVWIREGYSMGSWGYDPEMTKDVAVILAAFWKYAFEKIEVFESAFEDYRE